MEVEAYIAAYPQISSSNAAVETLIESEFVARSRWHTPPLISSYSDRFPLLAPQLEVKLMRALDEFAAVRLRILDCSAFNHITIVPSGVIVGRSTKQDEQVPHYDTDSNQFFVAHSSEKSTSRRQMKIHRIAYDQVRLTNLSKEALIKTSNFSIRPGAHTDRYLPTEVTWSNHRIAIELCRA